LAALKKAIKDTTPNGIVGSSLELAGCITSNFVKLVEACSPFKKLEERREEWRSHHPWHHSWSHEKHMPFKSFQEPQQAGEETPIKASFMEEINGVHFDFSDCVEMAKHQIYHNVGRSHFHRHGLIAIAIAIVILGASFAKGYHLGKHHHHHGHHRHHHHHHCLIARIIGKIIKFICHLFCCHHHKEDPDDPNGPGLVTKIVPDSEGEKVQYVQVVDEPVKA